MCCCLGAFTLLDGTKKVLDSQSRTKSLSFTDLPSLVDLPLTSDYQSLMHSLKSRSWVAASEVSPCTETSTPSQRSPHFAPTHDPSIQAATVRYC